MSKNKPSKKKTRIARRRPAPAPSRSGKRVDYWDDLQNSLIKSIVDVIKGEPMKALPLPHRIYVLEGAKLVIESSLEAAQMDATDIG